MALNETILQGVLAGGLTLAGVIYAAQKGLTTKREEFNAGANKSLDEAQQKFYDAALADLHLRLTEQTGLLATERMRATALQIECDIIREREDKALTTNRLLLDELAHHKFRLAQLETTAGVIGAVEVETKQIEEYKA